MPDRDVTFTFDEKPFQNGMKKVTRSMDGMQTSARNIARGVSSGMTKVIAKVGALAAGFLAVRNVLKSMPEVGQAFGIAKGIFLKNLLFPLRREIMPLLQRMLDWVREHRTAFTRWGHMLAGVFRTAVTIIRQFLRVAKQIGAAIFGDLDQFERRLNLFLFKVSLGAIFIGELLRPVAEAVGKIVALLARISGAFLRGLLDGLAGIGKPLERIWEAFKNIADAIFGTDFANFEEFFEMLGGTVGSLAIKMLEATATALEWIADMLDRIREGLESEAFKQTWGRLFRGEAQPEWGKEAEEEFRREMEKQGGGFLGWLRSTFDAYVEGLKKAELGFAPPGEGEFSDVRKALREMSEPGARKVRDVIITRRGEVVETHPEDTIFAARAPFPERAEPEPRISPEDFLPRAGLGFPGEMSLRVENNISVSVTEGDAEAAGKHFGEGVVQGLRDKIMDDMVRAGG